MNIVRDENGVMLMKVKPSLCNEMLNNLEGVIKVKTFEGGNKVKCFVLTTPQTLNNPSIGVIYLWEGSYIEL